MQQIFCQIFSKVFSEWGIPYNLLHSAYSCKCTAEFSTPDWISDAYCGYWLSYDVKWCYLANTPNVAQCPGAVKGSSYWTRDVGVCSARGEQPESLLLSKALKWLSMKKGAGK